jgi:hypothetical protein
MMSLRKTYTRLPRPAAVFKIQKEPGTKRSGPGQVSRFFMKTCALGGTTQNVMRLGGSKQISSQLQVKVALEANAP